MLVKDKRKRNHMTRAARTRRQSDTRAATEARILDAALEVFAANGFRGATLDAIAGAVGMSKPNVLYYYPGKREMYVALLDGLMETWLEPLEALEATGEPVEELRGYIRRKLDMARLYPRESRLFANEIVQGAPRIEPMLSGRLRALVREKAQVIGEWIAAGRLAPVDPVHLLFAIWATTQHYADFDAQVRAVAGADDARFETAQVTLEALFLDGLRPRG